MPGLGLYYNTEVNLYRLLIRLEGCSSWLSALQMSAGVVDHLDGYAFGNEHHVTGTLPFKPDEKSSPFVFNAADIDAASQGFQLLSHQVQA